MARACCWRGREGRRLRKRWRKKGRCRGGRGRREGEDAGRKGKSCRKSIL
jgi:hypothetical protein